MLIPPLQDRATKCVRTTLFTFEVRTYHYGSNSAQWRSGEFSALRPVHKYRTGNKVEPATCRSERTIAPCCRQPPGQSRQDVFCSCGKVLIGDDEARAEHIAATDLHVDKLWITTALLEEQAFNHYSTITALQSSSYEPFLHLPIGKSQSPRTSKSSLPLIPMTKDAVHSTHPGAIQPFPSASFEARLQQAATQ